jgi:hypothetical protein
VKLLLLTFIHIFLVIPCKLIEQAEGQKFGGNLLQWNFMHSVSITPKTFLPFENAHHLKFNFHQLFNTITILLLPLHPLSWKHILLIIIDRSLHIILRIHLILNDYAYEEKVTLKNLKGVCKGLQSFTVSCSTLFRMGFTSVCFYLTIKCSHFYWTLLCEQLSRKQSTTFHKTESWQHSTSLIQSAWDKKIWTLCDAYIFFCFWHHMSHYHILSLVWPF